MKKLSIVIPLFLAACSNSALEDKLPDNRPDYKQSRSINTLEIPPDLTSSSLDDSLVVPELSGANSASLSIYENERNGNKVSSGSNFERGLRNIHGSGDVKWIEIESNPTNVWKSIKNYWDINGIRLSREDQVLGVMETVWLEAKNSNPTTTSEKILDFIFSAASDSGVRDKFRTRLDYDGAKTYVYLTHYGATEEAVDDTGTKQKSDRRRKDDIGFAWIAGSRNPELEIEMLRRLSLYLDTNNNQKTVKNDSNIVSISNKLELNTLSDGTPALSINSDYNKAWILLGIAADRAGFEITNQDRKNGKYRLTQTTIEKSGLIFKSVNKTVDTYQLRLADNGDQQITVLESVNNTRPTASLAKSVLQRISQEIKF